MREKILKGALDKALKHKRCGLSIATGGGKTKIGLDYIEYFYTGALRVLIMAPKLSIFKTWENEATKFNLAYLLDHIEFTTYLSLNKCSPDYDIVILDEAHNLIGASHRPWLSRFNGRILGLSGTMPQYEKSDKGRMVDEFCPVVYECLTDTMVNASILNDYRIIVHQLELSSVKDFFVQGKIGKGFMTSELENYKYWSKRVDNATTNKELQITRIMRMKALMSFSTKEKYGKVLIDSISDKVILFANQQNQADRMCMFTYHSNNICSEENLELFRSGKILKLGAVQMLNEGINIPGLKEAVVMHSFSSSSPKSLQKLGRLLRLNPDDVATLHFLVYKHTVDIQWLNSILESIDPGKISYK